MARPFGPPPHAENTLTLPSGVTREHWLLRISVSTTEPSAHTTGPSGKPNPVARIVTSAMRPSLRLLLTTSVTASAAPSTAVGSTSGSDRNLLQDMQAVFPGVWLWVGIAAPVLWLALRLIVSQHDVRQRALFAID